MNLPNTAELQGQRAMMVIATIAGVFGLITAILGLDCVAAMQGSSAKVWTGRSGGILMILAGESFHSEIYKQQRF